MRPLRYLIWRPDDWNGFWTLLVQNLTSFALVTAILLRFYRMPQDIVLGHVLPGLGIGLSMGLASFCWLALRVSEKEKRNDVTALPYTVSQPALLVLVVGVVGPIYRQSVAQGLTPPDAGLLAWRVGVAATVLVGLTEMVLGVVVGPWMRRTFPRPALLGSLAGLALVTLTTVPMATIFEHPYVGFPVMAVILAGLVAGLRLPFGLPAGLVAVCAGVMLALTTGLSRLPESLDFRWAAPIPVPVDCWWGFYALFTDFSYLLLIIIPVGIYHMASTTLNHASASSEGDTYPLRACMLASGFGCVTAALFGACVPTTVGVGHPAYRRLGAGAGYGLGASLLLVIVTVTGLTGVLQDLLPAAAVNPLLVFVGLSVTAQAFTVTASGYSLAVVLAMIPHLSDLLVTKVQGVLSATDIPMDGSLVQILLDEQGVHWLGHSALAGGAVITGALWGAITLAVMERRMPRASGLSLLACLLTSLGIIHASKLTFSWGPIAAGYIILAIVFHVAYVLHLEVEPPTGRPPQLPPLSDEDEDDFADLDGEIEVEALDPPRSPTD